MTAYGLKQHGDALMAAQPTGMFFPHDLLYSPNTLPYGI